ncbi:MAG: FixG Ig-like domain-containing protein, partial [Aestuariivirga sp.]
DRLDITVQNDRNPQFVTLSDGSIRNGFTVKILNMEQRPRKFVLGLERFPGASMTMVGASEKATQQIAIDVEADKLRAVKVYVTASPQSLSDVQTEFAFTVVEEVSGVAPENRKQLAIFHAPPKEPNP